MRDNPVVCQPLQATFRNLNSTPSESVRRDLVYSLGHEAFVNETLTGPLGRTDPSRRGSLATGLLEIGSKRFDHIEKQLAVFLAER